MRSRTYECEITTEHNAIPYTNNTPNCAVDNQLRRINITGHTSAFAGGSIGRLCYKILKVENPSDSGESNNFAVSIYDSVIYEVLYKTYGTLSYPTTISYKRSGLRIIVSSISNIAIG